ncbi:MULTISPECIES: transposase [unclassified Arsukibacterium]|uniref:transposase n=1 Tax=unclassified Arsukibacterium TaxID=2635278 RepID=UPI000C8E3FF6|nr:MULTISPECIES: transposase [unclassified Arsukibacterium]MAA95097.1 transposase [Rheinheimera sp.]HAW94471.1 transposase [Candidatus Azambacteria bacterium]
MPRRKRYLIANMPYHVVQRGHNRCNCFYDEIDKACYLSILETYLTAYQVQLHAFVLMSNHVHLLLTAGKEGVISNVIQNLGRDYVHYFNKRYHRVGTLWDGRFKDSLVETDQYFLTCQRYIELNPVRAKMVAHPADYHWSSYHANARGIKIKVITPHQVYLNLAETSEKRLENYQALFEGGLPDHDLESIRDAIKHSYPLANESYIQYLTTKYNMRFGRRKKGRPEKGSE